MISLALAPAAALALRALVGGLGANPIETVTHQTGDWALRFLMLALAVTPARRLGWRRAASYRRTFGLLCFFYASLHVSTWIGLDLFFDWTRILEDIVERPYITVGALAFLSLVPLAITSTRRWIKRLGKRWTQLHRLAYVAAVAAVTHYLWLAKADLREPLVYAGIAALLLGFRVWYALRPRRTALSPRAA